MRETEQTAKTVEEAVQQGLHLLGVTREQVEVEVLEEPTNGLFGIGAKQAKVRVMVKELNTGKAQLLLEGVLQRLNLNATVDAMEEGDAVRFEVTGSGDDLGVLIGHRGQTLNALQFLMGVVLAKGMEDRKVSCMLDIEGYRVRREKALQMLAEKMAKKVSTERRSISLEPMLPHERRIIHVALENNPYVITSSQGKEPMRKVVIAPKEGRKNSGGPGGKDRTRQGGNQSHTSRSKPSSNGSRSKRYAPSQRTEPRMPSENR